MENQELQPTYEQKVRLFATEVALKKCGEGEDILQYAENLAKFILNGGSIEAPKPAKRK